MVAMGQTYSAGSRGEDEDHAHRSCCALGASGIVEDLNERVASRSHKHGVEVAQDICMMLVLSKLT